MTNCYLVWDDSRDAYLFDCGGENIEKLKSFIEKHNLNLKYLVLTHGHGDHIAGVNKLVEAFPNCKVYIGAEDEINLKKNEFSLMPYISGKNFIYNDKNPVIPVREGDYIGKFLVLDTPGHTIGSKCFYSKEANLLISGDTMFRRSFGRYDLPTSSGEAMFNSLAKLCRVLPPETKVYSGHSEPTTIGEETKFLKMQRLI